MKEFAFGGHRRVDVNAQGSAWWGVRPSPLSVTATVTGKGSGLCCGLGGVDRRDFSFVTFLFFSPRVF